MKKISSTIIVGALGLSLVTLPGLSEVSASTLTNREKLEVIQEMNPESTILGLQAEIEATAPEIGLNYSDTLDKIYRESVEEREDSISSVTEGGTTMTAASSKRSETLPASGIGNIYYTPAWLADGNGNVGHVGIYHYSDKVVEAPGIGKKSQLRNRSDIKVAKTYTRIGQVETSLTNRREAANYAKTYLTGQDYRLMFAINKRKGGYKNSLNCSSLVWYAYKNATGIDLDKDGGLGVYPRDIINNREYVTFVGGLY